MRVILALVGVGVALTTGTRLALAAGQPEAPPAFAQLTEPPVPGEPECPEPRVGYFDGLGAQCRRWEIRSDSAFGTQRIFTQQFEVAGAFPLSSRVFALVLRVSVAGDSDTTSGFYALHGPIPSIGFRNASRNNNYWVEAGVRLIPGWNDANDSDPRALQLAYTAATTSGVADDARWLSFAPTGYQVYGLIESRTVVDGGGSTFIFGSLYGGEISLSSLQVQSWLGPQTGVIGNGLLELSVSAPRIASRILGIQVGVHSEVSLSSIWPGNDSLPIHVDLFVGWNPFASFAVRAFYGWAGSPLSLPFANPFGVRLQYYLP